MIAQTELSLMRDMGADPTEYSTKDKELQNKFFHGFIGVAGPYTHRRMFNPEQEYWKVTGAPWSKIIQQPS